MNNMKKYLLIFFLVTSIFSTIAPRSLAADSYLNMIAGVGAGYYYLYPKDSQVSPFYKGEITYKGFIELKAESGLSVMGDISYYSEGNKSSTAPFGTSLSIVPITASVAYHFFKESSISPYLGAGLGIYNIRENDPDFSYLQATKFGKHIFAGMDLYLDRGTLLRAEIRDTFIDPVSNEYYYQASFSGLTATVNIAIEWPIGGKSSEPAPAVSNQVVQPSSISNNEYGSVINHINYIDPYYYQRSWGQTIYQPWNNPNVYVYIPPQPTQQQIDEQKAQAEKTKAEQEQKRQEYINQKLQLRQEKKEKVNPSGM